MAKEIDPTLPHTIVAGVLHRDDGNVGRLVDIIRIAEYLHPAIVAVHGEDHPHLGVNTITVDTAAVGDREAPGIVILEGGGEVVADRQVREAVVPVYPRMMVVHHVVDRDLTSVALLVVVWNVVLLVVSVTEITEGVDPEDAVVRVDLEEAGVVVEGVGILDLHPPPQLRLHPHLPRKISLI